MNEDDLDPDLEEFMASCEISNTEDKRQVTLVVKADEPFTGVRLEATLKSFIEAHADDFDNILDNSLMLQ